MQQEDKAALAAQYRPEDREAAAALYEQQQAAIAAQQAAAHDNAVIDILQRARSAGVDADPKHLRGLSGDNLAAWAASHLGSR